MADETQRAWVERVLGVRLPDDVVSSHNGAKLAPIWQVAKETVDAQLTALETAARATGLPLGIAIADHGLAGMLGHDYVGLMAVLIEHDRGGGNGEQIRSRLLAHAEGIRATLAGSRAVTLVETNPLRVPVMARAILGIALDAIQRQAGD
jgi:hypothetical protein